MVKVLVMFDSSNILAWLVNEDISVVEEHIRNGYPQLMEGYLVGEVIAKNIKVPEQNQFRSDLYRVSAGEVVQAIES